MSSNVYLAECDVGRGVFVSQPIAAGEIILTFTGPFLNYEQALAKGEAQANTLQIDQDRYIDIDPPGLFTNHSCEPNAGVIDDCILVALRDIEQDEEVRFDYSTTMSESNWTMVCQCGSHQCRGLIEDFHLLPELLKVRYLALGIVQRFIVAEHSERSQNLQQPQAWRYGYSVRPGVA
jgi:uncharacterized protein